MKRIISVLLIAAMTFSATGCLSKSKISSQNLVAYAEQRGSVVYSDVDEMNKDVNEHINSNDLDYFADGIVLTTDDVRYILNDGFLYEVSNSLYSKSVKEVTFFIAAENGGNTDNNSIVIVYALDYESNKDAQKGYENMITYFDGVMKEAEAAAGWETDRDSGKADGIKYTLGSASSSRQLRLYGYYQNGSSAMFICCMGDTYGSASDAMNDMCRNLGVVSPGKL